MPYLYCAEDGEAYLRSHEGRSEESYEGEGITVTKGSLIVEGCRCDKCNIPMSEGEIGYLIMHWLPDMSEEFVMYDFGYERDYMDFELEDITVLGWEWPE